MDDIDYSLNPKELQDAKASGKTIVGTLCRFLPEEVLHAAGMVPVRMRATGAKTDASGEVWLSTFSCPWARATLSEMLDGDLTYLDGLFCSNGCMIAQRIYDNWVYLDKSDRLYFQFSSPRVTDEHAIDFYVAAVNELQEYIEQKTGVRVTDEMIRESVVLFNHQRELMRQLYDLRLSGNPVISGADTMKWALAGMTMPREIFNQKLEAFLAKASMLQPIEGHDTRLVLIGASIDDPSYVKAIEDQDCLIVDDVTCLGRSSYEGTVELDGDIKRNLAEYYMKRVGCPVIIDSQAATMQHIVDRVHESHAQGVVFSRMMNCDCWGGMRLYFDEYFKNNGIPYIDMEMEELNINSGQVGVRVGALTEMLEDEY